MTLIQSILEKFDISKGKDYCWMKGPPSFSGHSPRSLSRSGGNRIYALYHTYIIGTSHMKEGNLARYLAVGIMEDNLSTHIYYNLNEH